MLLYLVQYLEFFNITAAVCEWRGLGCARNLSMKKSSFFGLLFVLQCVRQPLHGLVQSVALDGAGLEDLEGSILEGFET